MLSILIPLCIFSYFLVYKNSSTKEIARTENKIEIEKIKSIFLTSAYAQVQLELRDGTWWVLKPEEYLGGQELIEKALMSMSKLEPLESFELKEDRFGFDKPQGFLEFIYEDEQRLRFSVGSVSAAGQNLYVLNKDTNQVYVYHNVWGQFFYYPEKEFFHKNLPIIGEQVKKIQFYEKDELTWSIESHGAKDIKLFFKGSSFIKEKSQLLWFFNRLREFRLENLTFIEKTDFVKTSTRMMIETEKGNIMFGFREKELKIEVPSLKVFAEYESFSLTSLSDELKKVIDSDKK